jgi:hypothetical protein
MSKDETARGKYIITNHQINGWNMQTSYGSDENRPPHGTKLQD